MLFQVAKSQLKFRVLNSRSRATEFFEVYLTDRIPRQRGQERHKYAESLSYLKLFGIDAVLVVDGAVILHNTDQFGAGAVEVAARMQSHIAESLDHEYLKKWRKLTQQMKASFSQSMDTG